jgi:hypothetical protein
MLGSMRLKRYDGMRRLGELAQLVECCDRTAEARGSNPLFSISNEGQACRKGIDYDSHHAIALRIRLFALARPHRSIA